jgi:hypothetical protein
VRRRIRRGRPGRSGAAALFGALTLAGTVVPVALAQPAQTTDGPVPGALVAPAGATSEASPTTTVVSAPTTPGTATATPLAIAPVTSTDAATLGTALIVPAPVLSVAARQVTLTSGVESLTPHWSVTTTEGLGGFRIRYRPVATPALRWSAPIEVPATARSYKLAGLAPQRYEVLVRAMLASGTLGGGQVASGSALPASEKPASGCALYASNGGSDSNPGTSTAPFRTLKHLIVSLSAGQAGCLQSGQTFDSEPDSTGRGSIAIHAGESHGEAGAPVTITSTNLAEPAVISHSLSLDGGADWLTFTHLKFAWAVGQCSWSALGAASNCPSESHVQIAISAKHSSFTWDEITSEDTNICVNLVKYNGYTAGFTLLEHDVIHDCGTPVRAAGEAGYHPSINEEPGWHEHAVYDYGNNTTVRNSWFYNNARAALLFYPSGTGAVVEHNVIDHNGVGVWLAGTANVVVRGNIITNSFSPREYEDYGVGTYNPGLGNVVEGNCMFGNTSGEVSAWSPVEVLTNLLGTDPLYANAEAHEYSLAVGSPCAAEAPR